METERKIRTYGGYFEKFMETLNEKEQEKVQYGLLLLKTQERLSTKFVKVSETVSLSYALNMEGTFIGYFYFDEGNIVILFNGFQKKTQKTPNSEIEKAIKIKEAYYADKQSSTSRL